MLSATVIGLWLAIVTLAYGLQIQMPFSKLLYEVPSIKHLVAAIDGRSHWALPLLRLLQYESINLYAEYEGPPIEALSMMIQNRNYHWIKYLVDVRHIQKRPELFGLWRLQFYRFDLNFGVEAWRPGHFTPMQQAQILKDMVRKEKFHHIRSFKWCSRLSIENHQLIADMFRGSLIFLYPIKCLRIIFAHTSKAAEEYYQTLLDHDGKSQIVAGARLYLAIAKLPGGNKFRKVKDHLQAVLGRHHSELATLADAGPKKANYRKRLHALGLTISILSSHVKSVKSHLRAHIEADLATYLAELLNAPEKVADYVIGIMKRYPAAEVIDAHLGTLLKLVGRQRYLSQRLKDWPEQFAHIRYELLVPRSFQSDKLSLVTWRRQVISLERGEPLPYLDNRRNRLSNLRVMFEGFLRSSKIRVFQEVYVLCQPQNYISHVHGLTEYFSFLLTQKKIIIENPRCPTMYRFNCAASNLPYVGALVYAELVKLAIGSTNRLPFDPLVLKAVSMYPQHLLLAGRGALCVNHVDVGDYRSYLKAMRQVLARYSYFQ